MTEKPIGHCTLEVLAMLHHVIPGEDRIPIYTAPLKREWKGLTPEEILDLFYRNNVYGSKWIEFARAVEKLLKERNT